MLSEVRRTKVAGPVRERVLPSEAFAPTRRTMTLAWQLGLLARMDQASAVSALSGLQRTHGNRAVQRALYSDQGQAPRSEALAHHAAGAGGSFSVHGQTDATFDGGTSKMLSQKTKKNTACLDCPEGQCVRVTG